MSPLRIGQNTIQNVKDYKFLGVLIDDKLSFRTHVNKVLSKVSKSAGLLYKLRNCLPPETRLSYFYFLNYPHLSYNIATWGKAHECIIKLLFTAQKQIIRIIDAAQYREHRNPLFLNYSILKLNESFTYEVCIQIFKAMMVNPVNHSHTINTRDRDQM